MLSLSVFRSGNRIFFLFFLFFLNGFTYSSKTISRKSTIKQKRMNVNNKKKKSNFKKIFAKFSILLSSASNKIQEPSFLVIFFVTTILLLNLNSNYKFEKMKMVEKSVVPIIKKFKEKKEKVFLETYNNAVIGRNEEKQKERTEKAKLLHDEVINLQKRINDDILIVIFPNGEKKEISSIYSEKGTHETTKHIEDLDNLEYFLKNL